MSRLSGLTTGYIAATVLQAAESACGPVLSPPSPWPGSTPRNAGWPVVSPLTASHQFLCLFTLWRNRDGTGRSRAGLGRWRSASCP